MKKKLIGFVFLITLSLLLVYGILNLKTIEVEKTASKSEHIKNIATKNIDIKQAQQLVNFKIIDIEELPQGFNRKQIDAEVPPEDVGGREHLTRITFWYSDGNENMIVFEQTGHKMKPGNERSNEEIKIDYLTVYKIDCDCDNRFAKKVTYYWYVDDNSYFVDIIGGVQNEIQILKVLIEKTK
ncbi:hypothetical protein [Bacillus solimangrovi]|uniref:Uncharacterized protein n=1 Tax=Bacillus solimangrovi TaxID=1305675 RepID=A0A1E5LHP0_9BACI|nr:hypothetical protein [Bacillus solimangrovi]OEH93566.1 hypothetical protein BFG57_00835 [Bacillus solimangrovi]